MRTFAMLALLLTLSVRALAQPGAPTRPAVPFRVGETLTYDVSWSRFLTAGTVTLAVKERRPSQGGSAYYIVGEARPASLVARLYTLYYKAETLLDATTLLPQQGSIYSEEGSRRRTKTTRFDQQGHRAQYERRTDTIGRLDLTVPPDVHDGLSALYALRTRPLKTGQRFSLPVSDGGKVYMLHFSVGPAETIETGIGAIRALRLSPQLVEQGGGPIDRETTLWISDDSRRLLVKLDIDLLVGTFVLNLRSIQP